MTKNIKMKKNLKRSLTRELAMQYLFIMELQGDFNQALEAVNVENIFSLREEEPFDLDQEYLTSILKIVKENKGEIDGTIDEKATNWRLSRISKVDLSILRLSTAEIMYMPSVPKSASINEAIELAKKFGNEGSSKFINGILGKIATEG